MIFYTYWQILQIYMLSFKKHLYYTVKNVKKTFLLLFLFNLLKKNIQPVYIKLSKNESKDNENIIKDFCH